MDTEIAQGTERVINGQRRVYYDGYWIRAYDVPDDRWLAKKQLIEAMTRRLFNHVEHGINVPGVRLDEARAAFEAEADPAKKRVKGAMLAGALFNRATDIFTKLVELEGAGIRIQSDNALMRQCGLHLQEALELGKTVLHRSGEEGIDELWGEPFKAFAYPIEKFYESRYVKIAMTMRGIDEIAEVLFETFSAQHLFPGIDGVIWSFAKAAKINCETLRDDPDIFDVWSEFVVAGEKLCSYGPESGKNEPDRLLLERGQRLLMSARDLVLAITLARVPMPKTADVVLARCRTYRDALRSGIAEPQPESLRSPTMGYSLSS
ncbi:MAG TPA: hypothetical protein VEX18_04750 [Polyangiaceae bacterium]|nr:hypothetical protein [Polyangiaceae bacterium]